MHNITALYYFVDVILFIIFFFFALFSCCQLYARCTIRSLFQIILRAKTGQGIRMSHNVWRLRAKGLAQLKPK